jgi:hypothetical protein
VHLTFTMEDTHDSDEDSLPTLIDMDPDSESDDDSPPGLVDTDSDEEDEGEFIGGVWHACSTWSDSGSDDGSDHEANYDSDPQPFIIKDPTQIDPAGEWSSTATAMALSLSR